MKNVIACFLVSIASVSHASMELAQKNNCMVCHSVDKKVVGPAYKDVAKKYADKKDAVAYLSAKIRNGGAGVWGQMPMPANTQVNESDAKKLAEWVLKQK